MAVATLKTAIQEMTLEDDLGWTVTGGGDAADAAVHATLVALRERSQLDHSPADGDFGIRLAEEAAKLFGAELELHREPGTDEAEGTTTVH